MSPVTRHLHMDVRCLPVERVQRTASASAPAPSIDLCPTYQAGKQATPESSALLLPCNMSGLFDGESRGKGITQRKWGPLGFLSARRASLAVASMDGDVMIRWIAAVGELETGIIAVLRPSRYSRRTA